MTEFFFIEIIIKFHHKIKKITHLQHPSYFFRNKLMKYKKFQSLLKLGYYYPLPLSSQKQTKPQVRDRCVKSWFHINHNSLLYNLYTTSKLIYNKW